MGGNLTYHCLGNGQYELTFTFFRDCAGILPANTLEIDYYSSCDPGFYFTDLTLQNPPTQISTVCPTMTTTCNGGTYTGIEAYTYTGIVTLPVECNDWTFYHDECCRNAAITDIVDPDLQDQIIFSQLNNTNGICDDSPVFTNDPVPFACAGQPFCFNQGAYDADGDSLVYSLYPPLTLDPSLTQIVPVTYINGLSYNDPLFSNGGILFDPATGDFCVTPSQTQVTVFAVLVDEYRNGVYIGTVERDIQLTVNNCSNIVPTLTGINGGNSFDASVCAGQQLCFWVHTGDGNAADITTLTWNNGIPGASFTPTGTQRDSARFCWTPTAADAGSVPHCFTATVTDNACPYPATQTLSYCITVNSVNAAATATNVSCSGGATGSATVTASGGSPNYTYQWSPSGGNGATANNLSPGTYTVTVTDAIGCSTTATATVGQPTPVTANISTVNPSCAASNGSATASGAGGTGPYTYTWSPSGGNGATANNLGSGNYTVTITDSHGCTGTATTTLAAPSAPVPLVSSITNSTCLLPTGSITVNVSNGTAPYTYSWSPSGGNGATASNLQPGAYTCTVTDASGCSASVTASILAPVVPTVNITASADAACNGAANGSATAAGANGTPAYTYAWSPLGGNAPTANGLAAGNYTVTITDATGCTATTTVTISQPNPVSATVTSTDVLCNGGNTGTANANAGGGTGTLTYNWTPSGGNAANANNLAAGSYTVTVADANGCTTTAMATVNEPALLTVQVSSQPSICGQATGSAAAVENGGTSGYTYTWTPSGGNAANASNLASGSYDVTVTDANGCTASATAVVAMIPGPALSLNSNTDVSCNGGADGSASVSLNGGSAPVTFNWSPIGGTDSIGTNLPAGTYTVTVTDANGCTATTQAVINEPSPLTLAVTNSTNATCAGSNDGTIDILANGGTSVYTYTWLPSGNSSSLSSLAPGTYTATVTDANGCTTTVSATIAEPPPVTAAVSTIPVLCNGGATGSATVNAAGGTSGYTYQWAPAGGSNATASGLTAGNYDVTVTDANGCTASTTATVTEPAILTVQTANSTNVSCFGGNDGSATVAGNGGVTNYSYAWMPSGGNAATANGLSAGNYSVTLTDANGCTTSTSVTITEPSQLVSNIVSSTNVSCFGLSDGSATIFASGGTVVYSYQWSPAGGTNTTAGSLAAGSYTVTVTDANGCTSTSPVTISQPPLLTLSVQNSTNIACYGGSNGTINLQNSGGTAAYTYVWSPSVSAAQSASNLTAGTYAATITDANGCTASTAATLTQPTAIVLNTSSTPSLCGSANGTASVTAAGGAGGYSYAWTPSGGNAANAANLAAGNYTVTVTDASGCTMTATASVSNTGGPSIAAAVQSNVSCNGGNNGSATVNVSSGTAPFSYQWSPSGGSGASASNLPAGNFSITVTDANGCVSTDNVTITEPAALTLSVASTSVNCNGGNDGTVTTSVNGGVMAYNFTWNSSAANTGNLSNVSAGTYQVTVTDANGCTVSGSTTITQPPAIVLGVTNTPSNCGAANGTATVNANGGSGQFTYNWNPSGGNSAIANNLSAGSYSVTVTDANGCTQTSTTIVNNTGGANVTLASSSNVHCAGGNDGSASVNASGGVTPYTYHWSPYGGNVSAASSLTAGVYTVTVADATGCQNVLNVTITEPPAITIQSSTVSATCGSSNGSASITAAGGTGALSYSWTGYPAATGTTLSNIGSGNYQVTVTDATGCTASQNINVVSLGGANAMLQASSNVSCNGGNNGSATISATGGTLPLTYSWSPSGGNGTSASGLTAGTYIVTVTDATGCSTLVNVLISEPSALTLTPNSTPASCNGGTDGSVSVNVNGGIAPYTYQWQNNTLNQPQITGLGVGNYMVNVIDGNGCAEATVVTVNSATPIALNPITNDVSCNGAGNGFASVNPSGGTAPYTYNWSPYGGNSAIASQLSRGNFTITVTDANGCVSIDNLIIDEPSPLQMSVSPGTTLCIGQSTQLTASVSGGVLPYTYQWSNQFTDSSQTVSPLTTTNYTVSVTDGNGCLAGTQSIPVNVNPPLQVAVNGPFNICAGTEIQLTSAASGGNGNYTYNWSNGTVTSGQTITPAVSGPYTVTISDDCGTPAVQAVIDVTVNPVPVAAFGPYIINGCAPVTVEFHDNSTTTPNSTYSWNFGDETGSADQNPVHQYTEPGVYTVELEVETPEGCSDTQTNIQMVNVFENPAASFTATPPSVSILGPDITFNNQSQSADHYYWDFGDGSDISNEINPVHSYADTGSYTVMLVTTTDHGCIDTIYGVVRVEDEFTIYIPNAFTPNFDNVNDQFNAYGIGWKNFKMWILDRWGLNIYYSTDHDKPWDGSYESNGNPCQADVYVYKIQVEDTKGTLHSFIGHVSLVR